MTTQTTPLIWTGYDPAIRGLSIRDKDGRQLEPEIALVKFKDGWRQFARHNGIDGFSTTAWTIEPMEALKMQESKTTLYSKLTKRQFEAFIKTELDAYCKQCDARSANSKTSLKDLLDDFHSFVQEGFAP